MEVLGMSDPLLELRHNFVAACALLYQQGLCCGNTGNVSIRFPQGYLCTPSGYPLGMLKEDNLCLLDEYGNLVFGKKTTKEIHFHLAWYEANPNHTAVIHLHSPYATAYSCLDALNESDALPPLTPYQIMKIGRMPAAPYAAPGSSLLAEFVTRLAPGVSALFLSNHGFIAGGKDIESALETAIEIESCCRLFFILKNMKVSLLKVQDVEALLACKKV